MFRKFKLANSCKINFSCGLNWNNAHNIILHFYGIRDASGSAKFSLLLHVNQISYHQPTVILHTFAADVNVKHDKRLCLINKNMIVYSVGFKNFHQFDFILGRRPLKAVCMKYGAKQATIEHHAY